MAKVKPNYKELKAKLDDIIVGLQDETVDVDKAIELYSEGQKIILELEAYLKQASNSVKEIQAKFIRRT